MPSPSMAAWLAVWIAVQSLDCILRRSAYETSSSNPACLMVTRGEVTVRSTGTRCAELYSALQATSSMHH
jgi:hypothetical protein